MEPHVVAHHGSLFDNTPFISLLPFPVSLPDSLPPTVWVSFTNHLETNPCLRSASGKPNLRRKGWFAHPRDMLIPGGAGELFKNGLLKCALKEEGVRR